VAALSDSTKPINLDDYQAAAKARLPKMVYDYYAGGSWDELTLRRNDSAYDRYSLHYRVLRDVSKIELSTTVLGRPIALPVLIAPTAFHAMAHPEGEPATARAAGRIGTIQTVSTLSNFPIEEIVEAASEPIWFQLYVYRDREATRELLRRAESAGCEAIVLTVDAQIWGRRERDVRNSFQLPSALKMSNLMGNLESLPKGVEGSGLAAYVATLFDRSLTWKDVDWLCSESKLPVLIKGIVHPDDAKLAVEHGAQAVVVSNHGGRQVDTAPATIDVLADVVDAVDGGAEVILDGGVRRGSDVLKALALGARAVAVGRPVLWGLAVDGQAGVEDVFSLLRQEMEDVMGLCGVASVDQLDRDLLRL